LASPDHSPGENGDLFVEVGKLGLGERDLGVEFAAVSAKPDRQIVIGHRGSSSLANAIYFSARAVDERPQCFERHVLFRLRRFVTKIGRNQVARIRRFTPFGVQGLKKRNVDLVENLIARPVQVDAKPGDEPFPIDLAAYASPGEAGLVALVCCRTIASASMICPLSIGRS
jgi:hypothetical protein